MPNFYDYELMDLSEGRGVYDLADGVIPEMAEVFSVDIGDRPTSETLSNLVGEIGHSKALQENLPQVQAVLGTSDDALGIAAEWVDRSGVQAPLARSLWTPQAVAPKDVDSIVITGAVANWQDRTAKLLEDKVEDFSEGIVYIPVGNREMNTATEQSNENVGRFQESHDGQFPTETQYVESVIVPRLALKDYGVEVIPMQTNNGDEIAANFIIAQPELFVEPKKITFARVASAGIQLAVQFRKAARQQNPDFDADPANPQVFVMTDTFPLARNADQAKDPKNFQNPMTAIRQVAVTAKLLHEAANS